MKNTEKQRQYFSLFFFPQHKGHCVVEIARFMIFSSFYNLIQSDQNLVHNRAKSRRCLNSFLSFGALLLSTLCYPADKA